jgi:hypothetical protein
LVISRSSFVFSSRDLGVQGTQPLLPQGPVPTQPFIELGKCLRAQAVDAPLRLLADLDQPRLPQHPQVPGDARSGNRQQCHQLTGCRFAVGQSLKQRAPAVVGQRPQYRFHRLNVTIWLRNRQGT